MPVIDFHTHILPEIDDGSRSERMSLHMLGMAAAQGIEIVVATPHFYAGSVAVDEFLIKRRNAMERLSGIGMSGLPRIIPGAEVAFFSGIGRAEQIERLCIEGTNLMLLEMPFAAWSAHDLYEVELLLNRGIQPIAAHLERFYRFQRDERMIQALIDLPVYIQINAECLLDWRTRKRGLRLFRNRNAHLLGSDCHNLRTRPENLKQGRAVLSKHLGRSVLREIDHLGAKLLLPAAKE